LPAIMRLYRSKYADPEILPLVHALQKAGFQTCCSCQGGRGHQFTQPTIEIAAADREKTHAALQEWARANGHSISCLWMEYTSSRGLRAKHPRWRITFR
jgi:hypothetical protein